MKRLLILIALLLTHCNDPVIKEDSGIITRIYKPTMCYGLGVTINDDDNYIVKGSVQDLSKLRFKRVKFTYSTECVCLCNYKIIKLYEYNDSTATR